MTKNPRGTKSLFIGILTLLACVIFMFTYIRSVIFSPEAEIPLPVNAVATTSVTGNTGEWAIPSAEVTGQPVHLIIPGLKIDAPVQKVGIAKSGNMSPPSNFSDVGWYKYGTLPGQMGSAVMAGHVDNALGLAGVFKNLHEMRVGQDIYISTETGKVLHFRVTEIDSYDYKHVPTDMIFNQSDAPLLRLITCGGSWIQKDKSYDTRVVVTAVLVNWRESDLRQ